MTEQPTTPPADWTPPKWVAQFTKRDLQYLAVALQDRQHEARNRATIAESRLAVLEGARPRNQVLTAADGTEEPPLPATQP